MEQTGQWVTTHGLPQPVEHVPRGLWRDAVHSATGNGPLAGDYKGVDDVLAYYGKLFELTDGTFTAELKSTKVAGDDTVVAIHRDKGQRGGKTLDQDETLTFTISGGKFTHLVEDHSDQAAYDAFWS